MIIFFREFLLFFIVLISPVNKDFKSNTCFFIFKAFGQGFQMRYAGKLNKEFFGSEARKALVRWTTLNTEPGTSI